ncbi:MAG TPA: zf-HC2 domain-containing protein [Pyrinomonadaceae bacterium]|nr:zf-HC2 domain-containing protein [Pyrinomonadaceae bacterium]
MKQETNNEMDLLLRRLSRRDDAPVPDGGSNHLDADELSAYAEDALPAPARARYLAHLADCSRCRSLVVQLSSSAGVVATTETAKVAGPSGLKKFLASLFTPMVLRYAAPALGLIVVAAIGFVVLRREQSDKLVTQVTNNEQLSTPSPVEPAAGYSHDGITQSAPAPGEVAGKQEKTQQAVSSPVPNAAPVVSSVETDVSKNKAVEQSKPEEQPPAVAANEPRPAKVVPATPLDEKAKSVETEASKKEVRDETAIAPQASVKAMRDEREDKDKDNFARTRKAQDSTSARGGASVGGAQSSGFMFTPRTVAGRQFRREGGVWIDTAYDSSKDTVTVARNSEQYRALVADEPSIKTIADTLDGEIIVVWKGRTYRIR